MRRRVPNGGATRAASLGARIDEVIDEHLAASWPFAFVLVDDGPRAVDLVASAICEMAADETAIDRSGIWALAAVARHAQRIDAVPRRTGSAVLSALGWRLQVAVWAVEVQRLPLERTARVLNVSAVEVVRARVEVLAAFGWSSDSHVGDLRTLAPKLTPELIAAVRSRVDAWDAQDRATASFRRAGWVAAAAVLVAFGGVVGLPGANGDDDSPAVAPSGARSVPVIEIAPAASGLAAPVVVAPTELPLRKLAAVRTASIRPLPPVSAPAATPPAPTPVPAVAAPAAVVAPPAPAPVAEPAPAPTPEPATEEQAPPPPPAEEPEEDLVALPEPLPQIDEIVPEAVPLALELTVVAPPAADVLAADVGL